MAVQFMGQGRAKDAKPLAEKSIALRERLEGKNSLLAATAYLTLGQVETDLGNYVEGLALCKRSAMIREGFAGNQHDAACARDDAARCLEALGRLKEAREYRMGGPDKKLGLICGSTPCSAFASSHQKYSACGGCRAVWYCSKTCQKEDWKRHKKFCKPVQSAS